MKKLVITVAAGVASLVAGSEIVRAADPGQTVKAVGAVIAPWETRETGAVAKTDEDKRLGRRHQYVKLIEKYAKKYDVPVELAKAVVQVESNYRPTAKGKAGEIGLMQIKPATARLMGYDGPDHGLFDPETNIRFGMKYLAGAHELGDGKTCATILRYNAGHGAKRMNRVSQRYCARVEAILESKTQETASLSTVAS